MTHISGDSCPSLGVRHEVHGTLIRVDDTQRETS